MLKDNSVTWMMETWIFHVDANCCFGEVIYATIFPSSIGVQLLSGLFGHNYVQSLFCFYLFIKAFISLGDFLQIPSQDLGLFLL